MKRLLTVVTLLLALALALAPGTALAGESPVTGDCNHNLRLTHQYTIAQLENALSTMPPSISQYTDCADVIHRQLVAQLRLKALKGSAGGGGSSFLPVWLIVVLVVVVLGGVAATVAARRRPGGAP